MAARMSEKPFDNAVIAICYYLFAYVFTNLAVFLGIVTFSKFGGRRHRIDDYAGLSRRAPLMAFCMTVALLSLAGAPPLAGFFGKFYLLAATVEVSQFTDNTWLLTLAAIGAVNVVISMYYYLCVVKRMYMMEPPEDAEPITLTAPVKVALLACVLMILIVGIVQGPFVEMARGVLATIR
jgi:NADH-quinone oxidoreductase subunit N